jgi:regulator of replication initiation timing
MTQLPSDISVAKILESLDVINIADEELRQIIEILLNRIEQLESKVSILEAENQKLKDENNRLKGEKGKPKIKPSRSKNKETNHSSEKERHKPQAHRKSSKNENINIDREEILVIPLEQMPSDVQFKGYEEVLVQDIKLGTDNILFRKQKYYDPAEGKTYLAEMPVGYSGQFGPNMVLRRNISYGTRTLEGTKAWDTFLSLLATTRKLAVSFFEYVRSRICQNCEIPSLSKIINEKAMILQLGFSWSTTSLLSPVF